MNLLHATKTAIRNLGRNKLRTLLSLLGIVIGVFAVTIILSLGVAVKSAIIGYVNSFVGQDIIAINPAVPGASQSNSMQALLLGAAPNSLTYDDMLALADQRNIPYGLAVTGAISGQEFFRYGNKDYQSILAGVTAAYPKITPLIKIGEGRFFTDEEEKTLAPVVVIGRKVADKLFPGLDPIGQKVKLKDIQLTIIGVMKPQGSIIGLDLDTMGILPLRLMQKRLTGNDKLTEIDVRATDQAHVETTVADIDRLLRRRHQITDPSKDDFTVTTSEDVTARLNSITDAITYFLGFLAAISLVVGGIGIMNIMLVSVTERIREVGLRKALGAKKRDIMLQFLSESVVLTTVGGLAGGGLGFLITIIAVFFMRLAGLDVPYLVSFEAFLGGAGVAAAIGIIFGLQPAQKAASLDAITSLRYE